jgi:predicted acylesterase/phospholipase RssA
MSSPYPIHTVCLSDIDTLVFAGGGNRCWWQAGVMQRLIDAGHALPDELVGTSAGAAVAAACLTVGPKEAMQRCAAMFAGNKTLLEWDRSRWRFPRFVHDRLYPLWISSWVQEHSLETVRQSAQRLFVAVSHPSETLGLGWSLFFASIANILDSLQPRIHSYLPRYVGLQQSFIGLHECANAGEAQELLVASACAAPMLKPRRIANRAAFDGGYLDNAAVFEQDARQRQHTLVLLTRHDPRLPLIFRWNDRLYWQPSRTVPVSIWDCRQHTTVRDAFTHGWQDADRAIADGQILPAQ